MLSLLAGCATPKQEFDRRANAWVKKIAVVRVPEPQQYVVLGGKPSGLAVLGGPAAAIDQQAKNGYEFTLAMNKQGLRVGNQMTQALETELKKAGFDITVVSPSLPAGTKADGAGAYESSINTDADDILDVRVHLVGYSAPARVPDLSPWILASARMIATKSKAQLYFQRFTYGAVALGGDAASEIEHVLSTPDHAYASFDKLMEGSTEARKGIELGLGAVAARLAQQLGAPTVDPEACEQARELAKKAAATTGEVSAHYKRLAERKAEHCPAQESAAPAH